MRVLIVGAGIGGLASAIALRTKGHDVTVLERREALGELGAGIQVPPNAVKVLRRLGVMEAIGERAVAPKAIAARMGVSGREVFRVPLEDVSERRWGAPYLVTHRADYIEALAGALPEGVVRFGAEFASYKSVSGGLEVSLANGETLEADVLVGADGIRSRVRENVAVAGEPEFTGNVAWRATVPVAELGEYAPPNETCAWFGEGRHAVTYLLRGRELANFVGVVEQDHWKEESWTAQGTREEALADFAGWDARVVSIIAHAKAHYRWALFDREPLERWLDGRVVLLGDAAHPMLPFMAQGAAMAVEDAWVLAECIDDLPEYERRRKARASAAQAMSRANMGRFHKRGLARQLATYGPMWAAGRVLPGVVRARFDWLYGAEVV